MPGNLFGSKIIGIISGGLEQIDTADPPPVAENTSGKSLEDLIDEWIKKNPFNVPNEGGQGDPGGGPGGGGLGGGRPGGGPKSGGMRDDWGGGGHNPGGGGGNQGGGGSGNPVSGSNSSGSNSGHGRNSFNKSLSLIDEINRLRRVLAIQDEVWTKYSFPPTITELRNFDKYVEAWKGQFDYYRSQINIMSYILKIIPLPGLKFIEELIVNIFKEIVYALLDQGDDVLNDLRDDMFELAIIIYLLNLRLEAYKHFLDRNLNNTESYKEVLMEYNELLRLNSIYQKRMQDLQRQYQQRKDYLDKLDLLQKKKIK